MHAIAASFRRIARCCLPVVLALTFAAAASLAQPALEGESAQPTATLAAPVAAVTSPSLFDFLTPAGLAHVATYCAVAPAGPANEWLHGFMCGVRVTDIAIAIYAGLLVLVIAGLVLVGVIQYTHFARSARQRLRAYVLVETASRSGAHDYYPEFEITLRNFGQTPAYDVEHWIEIWPAEAKPEVALPRHRRTVETSDAALGPGGRFALVKRHEAAWEPEQLAAFNSGTAALHVYGEIRYRDAFRKRRYTRIRAIYALDNFAAGALTIGAKGNESN
ncbi:MAG TPA: hypothetical protein VMU87_02990 [Stellaceae bacterium]|nr:hypothetical protein [Stellaceae bacterium]